MTIDLRGANLRESWLVVELSKQPIGVCVRPARGKLAQGGTRDWFQTFLDVVLNSCIAIHHIVIKYTSAR